MELRIACVCVWNPGLIANGRAHPHKHTGIYPAVERMFGITPLELEDPGQLAYAPPAAIRCVSCIHVLYVYG